MRRLTALYLESQCVRICRHYNLKNFIYEKSPRFQLTYCRGRYLVSKCGRTEHGVASLHRIPRGPTPAYSRTKTEKDK